MPVIIKVPMARFQGVAYNWIKATGTLRLDPDSLLNANTFRAYAPLNNKVMELRKVASLRQRLPKLGAVAASSRRAVQCPFLPCPASGSAGRCMLLCQCP